MRSLFAKERIIKSFPQRETQNLNKGNKTLLGDPVVGSCSVYQEMQPLMDLNLEQGTPICFKVSGENGFYINSDSKIAISGSYLDSKSGNIKSIGSYDNIGVATCSATLDDFCFYEIKADIVTKASLFGFKFIDTNKQSTVESHTFQWVFTTHVAVKNNYERIVTDKRNEQTWNNELLVYINPYGSTATTNKVSGTEEYKLSNFEEVAQMTDNKIRFFSVETVKSGEDFWSVFDVSGKFTATGINQSAVFNTFDADVKELSFYPSVPSAGTDPQPDPQPQPETEVQVGLCKSSDYLDFTNVGFGTNKKQKITATNPLCVCAAGMEVFYINSQKPVKITGKSQDGKDIGAVENAYLFTTSGLENDHGPIKSRFYFEISTTEEQDIEIYGNKFGSYQDPTSNMSSVAILKSNYEGQFDVDSINNKGIIIFNPNGADVTASSENNMVLFTVPSADDVPNINHANVKNDFFLAYVDDKNAPASKASVTVKGKSNLIQLPEKVLDLKPLTIYAYESTDESSEETSSDIIESSDESSEETSSDLIESSDEGNGETNNDLKENADGGNEGLPKSAVIGIASGVSVLVIIIIVITVTIICIKKKNSQKVYNEQETSESSSNTQED